MIRHKRIGLRHLAPDDLPWLQRTGAETALRGEFMSGRMLSPHEAERRMKDNGLSNEDAERLLICDTAGTVIGDVVHYAAARYTTAREIGWFIAEPALRGQGLATEAAECLVNYLFENWPINRIQCGMATPNVASRRVAEKLGFQHEGVMRGVLFFKGEYVDGHVLGLLRSEWQARRAAGAG